MSDSTHLTLKVYSHHFSVTRLSPRGRSLCIEFAKKYAAWGWVNNRGHMQRVMTKIYGAALKNREEFRFHIHQLPAFEEMLANNFITSNLMVREQESLYEAVAAKMTVRAGWSAKDYQIPVIEYLDCPVPVSKMVDLQTGKGKGYVTMASCANFGKRAVVVVKPMYMQKWFEEIVEIYEDVGPEDIMMVKGSGQLMALIQLAKEGRLDAKFIIISNKTMQNWIKDYEELGDYSLETGWGCLPQDFFPVLGAGVRIIDELHQDWHLNFKIDLYTHVERSISLSATLLSEDPFMSKMYELAYPLKDRYAGMALDKYIDAYPVYYRFDKPGKIRTEEYGGRGYSHNAFEKSVMKSVLTMHNYFRLIENVMEMGYFQHPRAKKTLLIFCSTIEMCTALANHLKDKYPQIDTRRYVGEDDYTDLMEGQIVVSTIGSAGTAIDKPDLTNVILTIAVSSIKSNVQTFGRLRKLDDGHSDTQFHYFVCTDIPKHLEYDQAKQLVLAKRARSCRSIHSGHVV